MKKKFEGVLLASDIDNTLMHINTIPQANIDAIKYFTDNGGYFTIASGRNPITAIDIAKQSGANAPLVCLNGAMLYDFIKGQKIHDVLITEKIVEYVKVLGERFPNICFAYTTDDGYYFNGFNEFTKTFGKDNMQASLQKGIYKLGIPKDCPKNLHKIVILDFKENLDIIKKYGDEQNFDGVEFVKTSDTFLEIIPKNVNKGDGVLKLAEILRVEQKNVAAIGDYDNDIQMLKKVGHSAAPQNAPDYIKQLADVVVTKCEQGAVADFIRYLDKLY
ncbi:MAG: Cof-type HAD-IIB family hydrolase [Oscillospiraceae bacterium]